MSKSDSATIEKLRFPLVFLVVVLHSEYEAAGILNNALSHVLAHVAVPSFFFISGYLFFVNLSQWGKEVFINKLKRRYRSLFIPYILWITLFILWTLGIGLFLNILRGTFSVSTDMFSDSLGGARLYWDSIVNHRPIKGWLGITFSDTMPYLYPMWYVRDLMVATLLSPVAYFLLKQRKKNYVAYLTLVLLFFSYISNIFIHSIHGFSIICLFPFCLGAFYSLRNISFVKSFNKILAPSIIIGVLLFILEVYYDGRFTTIGSYMYPFWVIFGIISITNIVSTKKVGFTSKLSGSTFFVFAFHPFILNYCRICISSLTSIMPIFVAPYLNYILTPLLCVSVCVVLYDVLEKYIPSVSSILCGKR